MSRLSTPQPGQPIDYQYINDIVAAINELSAAKTLSKASDDNVQTDSLQISAQYKVVISNEKVTPGYVKGFSIPFKTTFQTQPVVTITAQRSPDTRNEASREVAIVIDNITTTSVTGQITFIGTSTGNATIGLNIIAVGVSPSKA
jgi:hypothetical protein